MKIQIADYSGFCYGVKRAVKITRDTAKIKKNIYTLGPLIHNEQMIEKLSEEGIHIIDKVDENIDGSVIIRSHGVALDVLHNANKMNIDIVDATCPYVKRIQNRVRECYSSGENIIIIGDCNHPEIVGINGWCENTAQIINSIHDANKLEDRGSSSLVVQTTYSQKKFAEIVDIAKEKIKNISIYNTICTATTNRQQSAKNLASTVDAMIIVGGKYSANSRKLYEICSEVCENTFFIQSYENLLMTSLKKYDSIGVSAGASTPDWILNEIIDKLRDEVYTDGV